MDAASDAWMINYYFVNGQTFYAVFCLGSVCLNLVLQLLLVAVQNRGLKENRTRTFLFDSALVLTFLKPGWDAHQVATNAEMQPGSAFDSPLMMLSYTKGVTMFAEDIPALLTQSVALLQSKRKAKTAMASLFISACSTGMISTSMSYDTETSPSQRKQNPSSMQCSV